MATGDISGGTYSTSTREEIDEKKGPATYSRNTPTEDELESATRESDLGFWNPGFAAQFPWIGLGALVGVLLCLGASIAVLALSQGTPQTHVDGKRTWPKEVAPNVLLSIFNNVANIFFGVAISNGIAIAWWRRALRGGTIKDLNKSWLFSSSFKHIASSGKAFNIIALTALVAKMTLVDSTLFQKAVGTMTMQRYVGVRDNVVEAYINDTFPSTGMGYENSTVASGLQDWFNRDLEIWSSSGGVYMATSNIYTTPYGEKTNPITRKTKFIGILHNGAAAYINLTGAGLQFDCLKPVRENITAHSLPAPSQTTENMPKEQLLFSIDFSVHHAVPGPTLDGQDAWVNNTDYVVMDTVYSTANDVSSDSNEIQCPGELVRQTCRLRSATVTYPVEISQRGETLLWTTRIASDYSYLPDAAPFWQFNETGKQQNYFTVEEVTNIRDYPYALPSGGGVSYSNNTYSGLALGLQAYLGGYAYISKDDSQDTYRLNQSGSAQSYLNHLPHRSSCNYNFSDPFQSGEDLLGRLGWGNESKFIDPGVVGKINSIMFGLAIDVSALDGNDDFSDYYYYTASLWADTIHHWHNMRFAFGAIISTIFCITCVLPSYYGFWQLGRKVTLGPFEIAAAFRAPNLNHETHASAPVEQLLKQVGERRVQFGHIVGGDDAGRIGIAEPEYVESVRTNGRPATRR